MDVTTGFGRKWKQFFAGLELRDGLDPQVPAHIWLLHFLFLDAVQEDAIAWANTWNFHKMRLRDAPDQTPAEMFFFSMHRDGPRGFERANEGSLPIAWNPETNTPENLERYGVDWEDHNDDNVMEHFFSQNPDENMDPGNFAPPQELSHVPCDPPPCPIRQEDIDRLQQLVLNHDHAQSQHMEGRRQIWIDALGFCMDL